MKQYLVFASLVMLAALPGVAKDRGGFLQTGSVLEVHFGTNSFFERSTTNLFDKQGNPTQTLTAEDDDGDGVADVLGSNTLFYESDFYTPGVRS